MEAELIYEFAILAEVGVEMLKFYIIIIDSAKIPVRLRYANFSKWILKHSKKIR